MGRKKVAAAPRFILDSSVTLAWGFADESDPYADSVAGSMPAAVAVVPTHWRLEVGNTLVLGERRGRVTPEQTTKFLTFLSSLRIIPDTQTADRAWTDTLELARRHGLTVYDAAYLELALRTGFPLASLDDRLTTAATACGVSRYTPDHTGSGPGRRRS